MYYNIDYPNWLKPHAFTLCSKGKLLFLAATAVTLWNQSLALNDPQFINILTVPKKYLWAQHYLPWWQWEQDWALKGVAPLRVLLISTSLGFHPELLFSESWGPIVGLPPSFLQSLGGQAIHVKAAVVVPGNVWGSPLCLTMFLGLLKMDVKGMSSLQHSLELLPITHLLAMHKLSYLSF